MTAKVDQEHCASCLVCVRSCPYGVPRINKDGVSEIDEALCRGCGVCASECPAKIIQLSWYDDDQVMNRSVKDIEGEVLVVSQFTLMANTKKGNRPSYVNAAVPEIAIPLYEDFCRSLELELGRKVSKGVFGANMQVRLLNDGPVTISIDTANK